MLAAAERTARPSAGWDDLAAFSGTSAGAQLLRELDEAEPGRALADLVVMCWCAYRRATRGRYLESLAYAAAGVDVLLYLMRMHGVDRFATRRRLESRDPVLARELLAIVMGAVPQPELALLDVAERRLRPALPDACWAALEEARNFMRPMREGIGPKP